MKSVNDTPCEIKGDRSYPFLGYKQDIDGDHFVAMVIDDETAYVVWSNTSFWYIGEDVSEYIQEMTYFTGNITLSNGKEEHES